MDFETFIHMNGYALNVWGSYGIGLVGYIGMLIWALVKYEKLKKQAEKK